MPTTSTLVTVLVMAVGIVGIVVPVLPGLLLVWLATVVWAVDRSTGPGTAGDARAWVVPALALVVYLAGLVIRYVVPGRQLRRTGVSSIGLVLAGLLAVVGAFVVPVIGLPLGFVLGVYLVELGRRRSAAAAWVATTAALRALVHAAAVDLLAALAIVAVWAAGLLWLGQA